jgi:hypothetical protein
MIEAQFLLAALEAFFNRPSQARRASQFGEAGGGRSEYEVVGTLFRLRTTAADQHPTLEALVDRPGQRDPSPIVEGPSGDLGESCCFGKGQAGVGDPVKPTPKPSTELSVVDCATNLQQQIGAFS